MPPSESYIPIGIGQLALAASLILVNVLLSLALRLGLTRSLLVAALRMTAQLILVGYVLEYIFALSAPLPVVAVALLMSGVASVAAVNRSSRRFAGVYWDSLLTILSAALLVSGIGLEGILGVAPWYEPQYVIPILGMVLGNSLTGISLALERFLEGLVRRREHVETLLALGATRWEAAHEEVQSAVRTGMIPTLNSMMVIGLVSLPGMMTGQILAGASPLSAVRYQIVIMFMLAAATALGSLGIVLLAYRRLLSPRHQLQLWRLDRPAARARRQAR